jgi:hypothetical protein
MKKKIKLTESDLENIIKRVLNEQTTTPIKEAITAPSTNKRETLLCPIQCKTKVLGKGNAGEDVKLIQNALVKCGFNQENFGGGMKVGCDKDHTKCDGKFNTETAKAVREFQKSVGITMDGLVGPKTLAKLMEGAGSCLSPIKCSCKKKEPIKNKPGVGADETKNLAPTDKVTVGCKKSISCFEKHKNDACGLANCLGICIPDGMCKGQMLDKPVNDVDCAKCPKYIWNGPQPAVYNKEKAKLREMCMSQCFSKGTRDEKLLKNNPKSFEPRI